MTSYGDVLFARDGPITGICIKFFKYWISDEKCQPHTTIERLLFLLATFVYSAFNFAYWNMGTLKNKNLKFMSGSAIFGHGEVRGEVLF